MKRIYLDNQATTPIDPHVFSAMEPCYGGAQPWGAASGQHWNQTTTLRKHCKNHTESMQNQRPKMTSKIIQNVKK